MTEHLREARYMKATKSPAFCRRTVGLLARAFAGVTLIACSHTDSEKAVGMQSEHVPFDTMVVSSPPHYFQRPRMRIAVTDSANWRATWRFAQGDSAAPPLVDFESSTVVVIGEELFADTSHSIAID